jgi:mRNA interferase MazF
MTEEHPLRGEIWLTDLNPIPGQPYDVPGEINKQRPALIVSADFVNKSKSGLAFVLPITRTFRSIPAHITIKPNEGGIKEVSYIMCDQIRAISRTRLLERWGRVTASTMSKVSESLLLLQGLIRMPTE